MAARALLDVCSQEITNAASEAQGKCALLHSPNLRLSTHFSKCGGGELAAYIAGHLFGLPVALLSQCEISDMCLDALKGSPLESPAVCQFRDVMSAASPKTIQDLQNKSICWKDSKLLISQGKLPQKVSSCLKHPGGKCGWPAADLDISSKTLTKEGIAGEKFLIYAKVLKFKQVKAVMFDTGTSEEAESMVSFA